MYQGSSLFDEKCLPLASLRGRIRFGRCSSGYLGVSSDDRGIARGEHGLRCPFRRVMFELNIIFDEGCVSGCLMMRVSLPTVPRGKAFSI